MFVPAAAVSLTVWVPKSNFSAAVCPPFPTALARTTPSTSILNLPGSPGGDSILVTVNVALLHVALQAFRAWTQAPRSGPLWAAAMQVSRSFSQPLVQFAKALFSTNAVHDLLVAENTWTLPFRLQSPPNS